MDSPLKLTLSFQKSPWSTYAEGALYLFFIRSRITDSQMANLLFILRNPMFDLSHVPKTMYQLKVSARSQQTYIFTGIKRLVPLSSKDPNPSESCYVTVETVATDGR